MNILVANIGSTSLKYRLYAFGEAGPELLAKGGFERVTDYAATINECLAELRQNGVLQEASDLDAVAFKVIVAKGVSGCVHLTEPVLEAMEHFSRLAPAHNPPYIAGIRQFAETLPGVPLIGLFETAFYQWAPPAFRRYAVPASWQEAGMERLGFHGASHKFIAERSAQLLGRQDLSVGIEDLYQKGPPAVAGEKPLRVISCHLGGSSSITGLRNGVAIGNSFGTSPQSGLPQNNRSGDLDPFALLHMMREENLDVAATEKLLCTEGGLKALSGGYNDLRDIKSQADSGNEQARLAIDVLVEQIRHWIGSFYLSLNGLDALVFTAGIGENNPWLREAVCRDLDQLGLQLDPTKNESLRGEEGEISSPNSPVKVLVIPTNEELVVAREAQRLLLHHTP
ncbi:MAG: acetate kinase [Opitutales bacterium]|nr:acetate kinase [Opitutales bacterium]